MWPFRKKARSAPPAQEDFPRAPPGDGWRRWFELSIRAAHDPPWHYEWVELWRPNWEWPRVTRSADIPYQLDGPGFWWRPAEPRRSEPDIIEGSATILSPDAGLPPDAGDESKQ